MFWNYCVSLLFVFLQVFRVTEYIWTTTGTHNSTWLCWTSGKVLLKVPPVSFIRCISNLKISGLPSFELFQFSLSWSLIFLSRIFCWLHGPLTKPINYVFFLAEFLEVADFQIQYGNLSGNGSKIGFPHLVFRKNMTKIWVGGSRVPPKDRPKCGFNNELCPPEKKDPPGLWWMCHVHVCVLIIYKLMLIRMNHSIVTWCSLTLKREKNIMLKYSLHVDVWQNVQQDLCKRWNFSASDTGILGKKEILSVPNMSRTYELPISTSDALPLSYRRLVVARPLN